MDLLTYHTVQYVRYTVGTTLNIWDSMDSMASYLNTKTYTIIYGTRKVFDIYGEK